MKFQEGKDKFIQAWGTLGSEWGVNRTMAQIHALLLISSEALSAQEIMDELQISLGNANMNLRALISWGLVYKQLKPGERKDFFIAEKDMWTVMKKIMAERKKKELEPMLRILEEVSQVKGTDTESKEFSKTVSEIHTFSKRADKTIDKLINADSNWFVSTFMKIMK